MEGGMGSYCLIGHRGSVEKGEKVLEMDGYTTVWMYLTPQNCTLKIVKMVNSVMYIYHSFLEVFKNICPSDCPGIQAQLCFLERPAGFIRAKMGEVERKNFGQSHQQPSYLRALILIIRDWHLSTPLYVFEYWIKINWCKVEFCSWKEAMWCINSDSKVI